MTEYRVRHGHNLFQKLTLSVFSDDNKSKRGHGDETKQQQLGTLCCIQ